jgi:hypothetical protein
VLAGCCRKKRRRHTVQAIAVELWGFGIVRL